MCKVWVEHDMDQSSKTLSRIRAPDKNTRRFYSTETASQELLLRTGARRWWIYTRGTAVDSVTVLALSHTADIT